MENTPPPVPGSPGPSTDNTLAVVMHLLGFAGLVFPPFGQILGPLILWLIKRSDSACLDRVGKDVLNFQISFTIYGAVAGALCYVLIGFLILPILGLLWLIFVIIAAVKTSNGEKYRYPLTIRLLQ